MNEEFGKPIEGGIIIKRFFQVDPETLWPYIVESEKRKRWFAGGQFDLRLGGEITLNFDDTNKTHEEGFSQEHECSENSCGGGMLQGKITAIETYNFISFTWGLEENSSEVKFTLTPQNGGTLLEIKHHKAVSENERHMVSSGWHAHIDTLVCLLEGKQAKSFKEKFSLAEKEYARILSC